MTLRSKQHRTRSAEEGRWRTVMKSAFVLVLQACDPEVAKPAIIACAEFVGEGEFARHVMLPMLDAKFSPIPPPEFPTNFVATHEAK